MAKKIPKRFVPKNGNLIVGYNKTLGLIEGVYLGFNDRGFICRDKTGKNRYLNYIINPEKEEISLEILKKWNDNPLPPYKFKGLCGIYLIFNHKEKTPYVGQSKRLDKRREEFYKHDSEYSGEDLRQARIRFPDFVNDWSYRVLQYCSEEELNKLEKDWLIRAIVKFKKTYNKIT